jgi:hypothetical protein
MPANKVGATVLRLRVYHWSLCVLQQYRLCFILLFGECYPAFLDLPDEAARLEPSESGDRVMFDSGCPQQVPITDRERLLSLEQLFEQSRETTADACSENTWRAGMPPDQPNPWSVWIPSVSPTYDRRWNLANVRPGQLYFIEVLSLEHPTVGGNQLILLGYDLKTKGYRVIPIKNKKLVGHAIREFIAREGLHKRPYQCTIFADGCGSMELARQATIGDQDNHTSLNFLPIPRNEPESNPAEGVVNDVHERVYATLKSAMNSDGPIDERHSVTITVHGELIQASKRAWVTWYHLGLQGMLSYRSH